MKIEAYIEKYSLSLVRPFSDGSAEKFAGRPQQMPPSLIPAPDSSNDKFELYTNSTETLWVMKNTSKGLFKITQYNEITELTSGWLHINYDYHTGAQTPL